MDYRALYTFVSETRRDVIEGVREDNVVLYGTADDGIVLDLVDTRKQQRGFPNDFYVSAPGWEFENPTWAQVITAGVHLGDLRLLGQLVGDVLGDGVDPGEAVARLGLIGAAEVRCLSFARVIQALAMQEDLNYPWANGRWTPFHLLNCLAAGADVTMLATSADEMADGRALNEDDCGDCDVCDRAMWRSAYPNRVKLRRYYE